MAKPRMSLSQTSLFSREDELLEGSIRELASHPRMLGFIEYVINDCTPDKPYLLFIPETIHKPLTKSRLYKMVKDFLRDNAFGAKCHVVFISNVLGICPEEYAACETSNFKLFGGFPDRTVIGRTAEIIARYLEKTKNNYEKRMVYARGSYLETVKMASENSGVNIESILTESDLVWLKRLGIKWMKIGLKMPECFSIFKKRIAEITDNEDVQMKISEFR